MRTLECVLLCAACGVRAAARARGNPRFARRFFKARRGENRRLGRGGFKREQNHGLFLGVLRGRQAGCPRGREIRAFQARRAV